MIPALRVPLFLVAPLLSLIVSASAAEPIVDASFEQEYRDPFIRGSEKEESRVHELAMDRDGIVWAATHAGLRIVDGTTLRQPDGIEINGPVFSVAASRDGTIWVGAWDGVHQVKSGQTERLSDVDGPVNLVRVVTGTAWAATPRGLFQHDGDTWRKREGDWTLPVLEVGVSNSAEYIAAISGVYRREDNRVEYLSQPGKRLSRNVRDLVVAPGGDVWVGSRGGIDVYRDGRRRDSFTGGDGLPSTDVHSLTFDADGILWVGTGLGVARYDGEIWSLRHSERWLPSDDVKDVLIAPDGAAWVATNDGIGVIRSRKMTLADKADHYQTIVRARHVRPPGLMERCRLEKPGDLSTYQPMDTDNDGMYTGLYLAGESYRYAVTKAPDAKTNAQEAFRALEFLQQVTGTPGFVARTVVPSDWESIADRNRTYTDEEVAAHLAREPRWKQVEERWRMSADGQWQWKGDTSSDETTGHFYSYGIYFDLVADEQEKERVATHVAKVTDHIINGGYVFRDIDGEATRWGVWAPEKLNDDPDWWIERGVNSVEILSYLTTAKHVTGDEKYELEIEKLLTEHRYAENILKPIDASPDYFTYIGMQLLAMSYPALLTYEDDPDRRELYLRSLETWFDNVRDDTSPFYGFVYGAFADGDFKQKECVELLRDAPLDQIEWTVDNSQREDITLVGRPAEGVVQTSRLLPASERGTFRWDRNVYDARRGTGGRTEGSTAFWLTPYWMGRYYGLISPPY
ncbi:MAG: hypothetical protein KDA93_01855 [Planctomycetaceae bacterium]|nr:hypothetical protein [Planctomycetaceae bacterium]